MTEPHAANVAEGAETTAGDHHAATDHGGTHGHDDHGHDEEPLGPIDVAAWGAGLLGIAISGVIAVAFVLATSIVG